MFVQCGTDFASLPVAASCQLNQLSNCTCELLSKLLCKPGRMGQKWPSINAFVRKLIAKQHVFFVATAPLSAEGHINVSPKGHCAQTFSILNDNTVAFLDLTGSGVETIAHVKENGRIVFMFCSFDDTPCIIRLWGKAAVHERGSATFNELLPKAFPNLDLNGVAEPINSTRDVSDFSYTHPGYAAGVRSIITCDVAEVASACGYAVPLMQYKSDRDSLLAWTANKGRAGLEQYILEKNATSLDGLKGIEAAFAADGNGRSSSMLSACSVCKGYVKPLCSKSSMESVALLATGVVLGFVLGACAAKHA